MSKRYQQEISNTIIGDEIDFMIYSLFDENDSLFEKNNCSIPHKRIKFSDEWKVTTEKNIIHLNGSNIERAISNTSTKLDNLKTSTSISYEKFSKLCKEHKIIELQEYELNEDNFIIDTTYNINDKLKNIKKIFKNHVDKIKTYVSQNFQSFDKIEDSKIKKLSKQKQHTANLYNREIEDLDVILKELDNPSKWISVLNFY